MLTIEFEIYFTKKVKKIEMSTKISFESLSSPQFKLYSVLTPKNVKISGIYTKDHWC